MGAAMIPILLILLASAVYANEEITVELPGGATMEFVWIEPGTFVMGTTDAQEQTLRENGQWDDWFENERPAHEVTIAEGFYLGRYEVTQAQWESVTGEAPWSKDVNVTDNPDAWQHPDGLQSHPAVDLLWEEVESFVATLNSHSGGVWYRLPTEAEWEYACRAGTATLWSAGDVESQLAERAWYWGSECDVTLDQCLYSHAVGTKRANPWGLFDMHGNVWEWVQDWWGPYTKEPQIDPAGPLSGSRRVVRGGAYHQGAEDARSAMRSHFPVSNRNPDLGIRLLRIGPKITAVTCETWGQIKDAQ